ncbi:MAG TPA: T9SS type A sorting domain-containing protein, partial [Patescibacteria group bacterium]|nr:T9SS type A sorting domain-containing protein [Patescibacteria group bacterium]
TQDDAGTYTVRVTGECGEVTSGGSLVIVGPNSVESYAGMAGIILEQTIPNPFSSEAIVKFSLPASTNTVIYIRDIFGRTLQTLNLGRMEAGNHSTTIQAMDMPAGTYYYTLQTDNANITRRFLIVR